jgi:VacB/RNase II family 3'-5' exoribonuclease
MVSHRVAGAPLDFPALRAELGVPGDFSAEVVADAQRSLDANQPEGVVDATDIPFVTVDPAGSRDLDQAVHLTEVSDGFVVRYAIADVAAFVRPGSPVDVEANARGETLYFPDLRVPLYPTVLSESAASLLAGQVRPAVLWQIALDERGQVTSVDVARARVRSQAQLDYDSVQLALVDGTLPEALTCLERVGTLRRELARQRHAIDLDLPDQEVAPDGSGAFTIQLRRPLPVEIYNAEISLLTGMCAATLMLSVGVGIVRTVPSPDAGAVKSLRRAARSLGIAWPDGAEPGDVLADADRGSPRDVAFVEHAASLLRGAGYAAFDGVAPEHPQHAGIGAPYAHVTAPLRRLVDRYASEICLSIQGKTPVPDWVRARLPQLPEQMRESDQRAHLVDRAVVDATEAWLLRGDVGRVFAATVIDADERAATILVDTPPVRARCHGDHLPIGGRITARLVAADVATRTVTFERAG